MNRYGSDPARPPSETLDIARLLPRLGGMSGASLAHAADDARGPAPRVTLPALGRWAAVLTSLGRAWR